MIERGLQFDLGRFLDTIESAPPGAAVEVFAAELVHWLDADRIRFLITDLNGEALVPLGGASAATFYDFEPGESLTLTEHPAHERALTTQEVQVSVRAGATTYLAPVTARGDTIGVLDVRVLGVGSPGLTDVVAGAAHALAYVVTTERRHSDLFEWGTRSDPVSLAAEIQRRLLPSAFTCEAGPVTVSAWLEPANRVGGDTFDYALDEDRLYLSLTDAMGHGIDAALLATLTVGALRNGRRRRLALDAMAVNASGAIFGQRHGSGFVTGQVAMIELATGVLSIVNAGHPPPLVARDGHAHAIDLVPDVPFGVLPEPAYRVQQFRLRAGDRIMFVTDGMLESNASQFDVAALVEDTRALHARQALQTVMRMLIGMTTGNLRDDATAMCLDWYGPGHERMATGGALHDLARRTEMP